MSHLPTFLTNSTLAKINIRKLSPTNAFVLRCPSLPRLFYYLRESYGGRAKHLVSA